MTMFLFLTIMWGFGAYYFRAEGLRMFRSLKPTPKKAIPKRIFDQDWDLVAPTLYAALREELGMSHHEATSWCSKYFGIYAGVISHIVRPMTPWARLQETRYDFR